MQRKPGFPVANCSIKVPDNLLVMDASPEEDGDQHHRRQQLINFGHSQWGFNNWNWAVTKQELDFVDQSNGKYCAGVVAFVSVSIKNININRENIGYATSVAGNKGFAIYKSRKVAVTNALRETLLSFGGTVAAELTELLETNREILTEPQTENNQNIANQSIPINQTITNNQNVANNQMIANNQNIANPIMNNQNTANTQIMNNQNTANNQIITSTIANNSSIANIPKPILEGPPLIKNLRKDSTDAPANIPVNAVKNAAPIAKAHPIPANVPRVPANPRPPPPPQIQHPRPNSNEARPEGTSDEEARAERKRRQRMAQEEFRQKQQLGKQGTIDEKQGNASLERLLMDIPTQDIVIEDTGASHKRKSPTLDAGSSKRRISISKLDILHD